MRCSKSVRDMFWRKKKQSSIIPLEVYDAALQGNPRAQYVLGAALASATGAERDITGGTLLLRQAAEAGYEKAYCLLYKIALGESFGVHDTVNGVEWLRKAADTGDAEAERTLGLMMIDGYRDIVKPDLVTARALIRDAADKGDQEAARICRERF